MKVLTKSICKIKPEILEEIKKASKLESLKFSSKEYDYLTEKELQNIQENIDYFSGLIDYKIHDSNNNLLTLLKCNIKMPKHCCIDLKTTTTVDFSNCPNYFIYEASSLEEKVAITNKAIDNNYTILFNYTANTLIVEGIKQVNFI